MTRLEQKIIDSLQTKRGREIFVRISLWSVPVSILAWPVGALTFAKDEPMTVLGLSFIAIINGAWIALLTAEIHRENDQ